jgi:Tol biopolymer transport system component
VGTGWIVFQTDVGAGDRIYMMRPDGSGLHPLVPTLALEQKHPDWSPDGSRITFVAGDDIWIADSTGENATKARDCSFACDFPAWSPDGTSIAFTEYEDGPAGPSASTIRIIDLAKKAVRDVVRIARPHLVDVPRWAPDGDSLVVGVDQMDDSGNESGAAIGTVPATGGDIAYLREFGSYAYYPDWSWATDTILFSTEALEYKATRTTDENTWNLWTIRPDGMDLRQVTDVSDGIRLWQPSWTPDGTRIIADREEDRVGVQVDPGTGGVQELAYRSSPVTHPRVEPEP